MAGTLLPVTVGNVAGMGAVFPLLPSIAHKALAAAGAGAL